MVLVRHFGLLQIYFIQAQETFFHQNKEYKISQIQIFKLLNESRIHKAATIAIAEIVIGALGVF